MIPRIWSRLALATALIVATSAWGQSGRHADPELEARLPTVLGGVALTIESQAGTDLTTQSAAFDAFLGGLGKSRSDFIVASAYAQRGLPAAVGAWRVRGVDPARLMPGFIAAIQASSTTRLTVAEESIAGRPVTRIGDKGQLTQGPLRAVLIDDAIFFVQSPEQRLAEEAIQKLPR